MFSLVKVGRNKAINTINLIINLIKMKETLGKRLEYEIRGIDARYEQL